MNISFFIFIFIIAILIYTIFVFLKSYRFCEKLTDKKNKNIVLHVVYKNKIENNLDSNKLDELESNYNLRKLQNIIESSENYAKNIDIYIHSSEKIPIITNNYKNGRIIKVIHDLSESIEDIKKRMENIIRRNKKIYDTIIRITHNDYEKLNKILNKKVGFFNYFGKNSIEIL